MRGSGGKRVLGCLIYGDRLAIVDSRFGRACHRQSTVH